MRFAILFLLVGLAIGLWLGFNPAAHRDVVRWWDRTSRTEASASVPSAISSRQLNRSLSRLLRSTPRSQPAAPQPDHGTVPTGNQISTELQALWNALQRIWLDFIARLTKAS
jgi:hypothetical protein